MDDAAAGAGRPMVATGSGPTAPRTLGVAQASAAWAAAPGGGASFDVGVARRLSVAPTEDAVRALRTGSFDDFQLRPRRTQTQLLRENLLLLRRPQAGIAGQFAMPVLAPDLDGDRPLVGETGPEEGVKFTLFQPSLTPLLQSRFGWHILVGLVLVFLCLDSSRYMVDAWAMGHDRKDAFVLAQALVLFQAIFSFVTSLAVSLLFEGCGGLRQAFEPKEVFQCLPISVGFSLASACTAHAYSMGLGPAVAVSLGYLYMPLCAFLSRWIFGRAYGWLDIQALILLTLSSLTFAELRSRAIVLSEDISGAWFVAASVILSCCASLAAEWSLKRKYNANIATRFYLQKVRLEFWGLFTSALVLKFLTDYSSLWGALGGWDYKLTISLCIRVGQSWLAMVVARHLSSVAKAVIQCLSLIIVFFIGDLVIKDYPATFMAELVLSFLALVVSLSALLYQMGRSRTVAEMKLQDDDGFQEEEESQHLQGEPPQPADAAPPTSAGGSAPQVSHRSRASGQLEMDRIDELGPAGLAAPAARLRSVSDPLEQRGRAPAASFPGASRPPPPPPAVRASFEPEWCALGPDELEGPSVRRTRCRWSLRHGLVSNRFFQEAQETNPRLANWLRSQGGLIVQVGCVVFFIISDASRTIINEWALGDAAIVQQSIVVSMALASIVIGTALAAVKEGWAGVQAALSPKEAIGFLPVSAVFSVGQTCQIYAYGFGITAVENTVIGYFYMPLSALLSRLIFRRYYSLLEWLALTLLMLSATAFVLMQDTGGKGGALNPLGVVCVCGSVLFSCLGSVLAEKFMKRSDCAFYIQKVQLEVGDLLMASAMLVITGAISNRPKDAFWKERDVGGGHMEKGVFAGWNLKICIVLAATLTQSWLGGLVAKQLSTVIRAVAQCLSLLLIYFIGDLVLKHVKFDWPQGTMAVVVALTVQVFVLANPRKPTPRSEEPEEAPGGEEQELPAHEVTAEVGAPGDSFSANPAAVPLRRKDPMLATF